MKRLLLVVLFVVLAGCASTYDESKDLDKCEMEAREKCSGNDSCYEEYVTGCMNKMGYFY